MTDASSLPAFCGETRMCEIVFPEDTNPHGTMFGGRALQLMDKAAGVAAARYCHHPVVTASSDRVNFSVPIPQGSIIELVAKVVFTGRTSLVVKVDLYCEGRLATQRVLATSGYLTMVAVDPELKPLPVIPPLELETDADRVEWEAAKRMRGRPQ